MKQFLDFLPLIVFFVCYKLYGVRTATEALIIVTALVLIYSWFRFRKLEKAPLITFIMVAIFGGLTIYFDNLDFLKWKVTLLYLLFSAALLVSQWWLKTPLIQRLLGKEIKLPAAVWRRLNFAWALFFIACALLNIYLAYHVSESLWVDFKVFGLTGITLVFTLLSGIYLYRHLATEKKSPDTDSQATNQDQQDQ